MTADKQTDGRTDEQNAQWGLWDGCTTNVCIAQYRWIRDRFLSIGCWAL